VSEDKKTVEPQYELLHAVKEKHGTTQLGVMVNESWNEDPRRTVFTLARYKFVSKMLAGKDRVLEVGCADAFGTRVVQQTVNQITAVDFDPLFIEDVRSRANQHWPLETMVHDMLKGPVPGQYDAVYALDVLEHINPKDEEVFLENSLGSLAPEGVAIFGMPSLESQFYASPQSKEGHVNCKTGSDFRALMEKYFHSVFMFSMNDEVVHTGYFPMANYLLAVASHRKTS